MSILLVAALVLLNFGISWWNAIVAGKSWVESKHLGGFIRLVVWSAAVQSACGFSMVFTILLAGLAYGTGYLPMAAVKALLELNYLLIIVPVLGSGMIITIHSWMVAIRERSLMDMGTAAYNTFAMAHNTYSAVSGIGDVIGDLSGFFSDDDDSDGAKTKIIVLVLVLAVIAACAGIFLTVAIIKHYAGTSRLPYEANISKSGKVEYGYSRRERT